MTKSSLRTYLTKYVISHGLQPASKSYVEVNKLLADTLHDGKVELLNSYITLPELYDR